MTDEDPPKPPTQMGAFLMGVGVTLVIVFVLGILGLVFLDVNRNKPSGSTTGVTVRPPKPAKPAKPVVIDKKFTPLKVDTEAKHILKISAEMVPGQLTGTWTCQGKSAGLAKATDDKLIRFELRGPNNELILEAAKQETGSFSREITVPGTYTFIFSNKGIIRQSDRNVTLKGEYVRKN